VDSVDGKLHALEDRRDPQQAAIVDEGDVLGLRMGVLEITAFPSWMPWRARAGLGPENLEETVEVRLPPDFLERDDVRLHPGDKLPDGGGPRVLAAVNVAGQDRERQLARRRFLREEPAPGAAAPAARARLQPQPAGARSKVFVFQTASRRWKQGARYSWDSRHQHFV